MTVAPGAAPGGEGLVPEPVGAFEHAVATERIKVAAAAARSPGLAAAIS